MGSDVIVGCWNPICGRVPEKANLSTACNWIDRFRTGYPRQECLPICAENSALQNAKYFARFEGKHRPTAIAICHSNIELEEPHMFFGDKRSWND